MPRGTSRRSIPGSHRGPPQRLLRMGRHPAEGTVRLYTPAFDGRYQVRGAASAGTGEEQGCPAVYVLDRPRQNLKSVQPR